MSKRRVNKYGLPMSEQIRRGKLTVEKAILIYTDPESPYKRKDKDMMPSSSTIRKWRKIEFEYKLRHPEVIPTIQCECGSLPNPKVVEGPQNIKISCPVHLMGF